MNQDGEMVLCGVCKAPIDEAFGLPVEQRAPCPNCTSLARAYEKPVTATLQTKASIGAKKFLYGRSKKKGLVLEFFDGWELSKKFGILVRKFRRIDRENNRYEEHVETPDGVHHTDEPLSEHQGHGSDRKRRE